MTMNRNHRTIETEAARLPPTPIAGNDDADWDEIAESSWESFPASDPPAWAGQRSPRPAAAMLIDPS